MPFLDSWSQTFWMDYNIYIYDDGTLQSHKHGMPMNYYYCVLQRAHLKHFYLISSRCTVNCTHPLRSSCFDFGFSQSALHECVCVCVHCDSSFAILATALISRAGRVKKGDLYTPTDVWPFADIHFSRCTIEKFKLPVSGDLNSELSRNQN